MPMYRVQLPPEVLRYRNGKVRLETARDGDAWVWRAVKADGATVVLLRRDTLVAFARDRFEGFEVKEGTPAEKILARLAREGAAMLTRPGEILRPSNRERDRR